MLFAQTFHWWLCVMRLLGLEGLGGRLAKAFMYVELAKVNFSMALSQASESRVETLQANNRDFEARLNAAYRLNLFL